MKHLRRHPLPTRRPFFSLADQLRMQRDANGQTEWTWGLEQGAPLSIMDAWNVVEDGDPDISTEKLYAMVMDMTGATYEEVSDALAEAVT